MIARRSFITGLAAALAAPAIIRPGILMPVKRLLLPPALVPPMFGITGQMVPFYGGDVPGNWLSAAGQDVSRVLYRDLFAVIGTKFGAGDGASTFSLPDARGAIIGEMSSPGGKAVLITRPVDLIICARPAHEA